MPVSLRLAPITANLDSTSASVRPSAQCLSLRLWPIWPLQPYSCPQQGRIVLAVSHIVFDIYTLRAEGGEGGGGGDMQVLSEQYDLAECMQ